MRATLELHHRLLAVADSLEPLPTAALQLAGAVNDPETGPKNVAAILGTDPALAAHVLRDANSAAHGSRSPIGSLEQELDGRTAPLRSDLGTGISDRPGVRSVDGATSHS